MRNILYVANLADSTIQEQIESIFADFGQVGSITFGLDERFNTRFALVTLPNEKSATKANHTLNGYQLDGHYLSISYPDVDLSVIEKGLSSRQRKTAQEVCEALGETYRKPVRRIHTMILLCGHSFVLHLVKEAQEIHAAEGMMTADGSRRRTLGGIFFMLARARLAPPLYSIIHSRGGKLPGYQPKDDTLINHLVVNPKIISEN